METTFFIMGSKLSNFANRLNTETNFFIYKDPTDPSGGFTDGVRTGLPGWNCFNDDDDLENCVASYGLGLNFRLGFMELNWVFSQRINSDTDDRWRSAFYIGNKF